MPLLTKGLGAGGFLVMEGLQSNGLAVVLVPVGVLAADPSLPYIYVGDDLSIDRYVANLPSGTLLTTAIWVLKANEADRQAAAIIVKSIDTTLGNDGTIISAGQTQPDGSVRGELYFYLSGLSDTSLLAPNTTYWWYIHCTTINARGIGSYTSQHATLTTRAGGPYG